MLPFNHNIFKSIIQSSDTKIAEFSENSKVRFICQVRDLDLFVQNRISKSFLIYLNISKNCKNPWTSMKGKIKFICIQHDDYGYVMFHLYGQKCEKCAIRVFQDPLLYPEEVIRV